MVSNITEHVAVVNFYWGAIAKTDVLIHLQTQLHVLVLFIYKIRSDSKFIGQTDTF